MSNSYYIVYSPRTYNLMDMKDKCDNPWDLLKFLVKKSKINIDLKNFVKYLSFEENIERVNLLDAIGVESYATYYIANQIARLDKESNVVLIDGKRKTFEDVIKKKGMPKAVFISSMSSNFPTTVVSSLVLNQVRVPVVIGGIHVSTSSEDVNNYIKKYAKYPNLITFVKGPGDSNVIQELLIDIEKNHFNKFYEGSLSIEDGVWGQENVEMMKPIKLDFFDKIPFVGKYLSKNFRILPTTPYLGCPFSCRFCSISTLPFSQRKFKARSIKDFLKELLFYQKDGVSLKNRFFFFLSDNILLNKRYLNELLDKIIESKVKINYAVQASINIADDEKLLKKLRLSGCTFFFVGLESLDIRNLKHVRKHCVRDIKKSGLSVEKYYQNKIAKIHSYGIFVFASFIIGLPYDYFNSLNDNTGVDILNFCKKNHLGVQPSILTDLPGSLDFRDSIKNNNFLYGNPGDMNFLISLCISDLTETNRIPPDKLFNSPGVISYMAYQCAQGVGSKWQSIKNGFFIGLKSWKNPTKNGKKIRGKFIDSICSFASQGAFSFYREFTYKLAKSNKYTKGCVERLYEEEQNPIVKKMFEKWVKDFR